MTHQEKDEKLGVHIERWDPRYQEDFVRLNKRWIELYFCLEESDLKLLGDPKGSIIDRGGELFFALLKDEVVGCCALVRHPENGRYELAKMAVDPAAQGQGIGMALGKELLAYAWSKGIKRLFLEANTKMEASVRLYHKLGFRDVEADHPAYQRCNLYMEWNETNS